jgi:hypothetical protein
MASQKLNTSRLAELHRDTLLNESALSEMLDVHPRTVRRMEENGQLPPHFKLGGYSCWIVGNVIGHFYEQAQKAQADVIEEQEILDKYLP